MTQPLRPKDQRLYAYLSDLADAGAECPTNRDLAEAMGCTAVSISDILARLNLQRAIRTVKESGRRSITIVATKKVTRGPGFGSVPFTALLRGMSAIVPHDTTLDRARVHRMGSAAMIPHHHAEAGAPCWFCQSRVEVCGCASGMRVRACG